jgi:transposase InsO family protein
MLLPRAPRPGTISLGCAPVDALDRAFHTPTTRWPTTRWPKRGSRPFKTELVDGRRFPNFERAEHEVLHWIGFYNGERLHEELDDLPPVEYEELNINNDNSRTLAAR